MILETLLRTIQQYKLITTNQTLILGVSGGVDSLAMMHLFAQIRSILPINLHVATYNHGIRGQSAEDDCIFVSHMAQKWHIPYTVGSGDVPQLAKESQQGIEAAARKARYDFFAQIAADCGADTVAVAHHADDQAETILMHIIRGSGLKGLTGMSHIASMPYYPQLRLIRPLLQFTRAQLETYCTEHDLSPREDESNSNADYRRNYIRHVVLRDLQEVNPNISGALVRLGETVSIDESYLAQEFKTKVLQYTTIQGKRWQIPHTIFKTLHTSMQHRFIVSGFNSLNDADSALTYENIVHAVQLALDGNIGKIAELGGGLRVRIAYDDVVLEHESYPLDTGDLRLISENTHVKLSIPSIVSMSGLEIRLSYEKPDLANLILELPENMNFFIRTRRAGDRFSPQGMHGHSRKLKDWMIDQKIPRHVRNKIPLIVVGESIVAICVGSIWHLADVSQFNDKLENRIYLTLV